ncbi:MAG: metallophosphoesterase family protein [Anaerolineae bacterium]|nr:metallophosphatase family protein [Caldilineales bacterium]MCX7852167.1 metallophosphatase family protein [Caldilineales bacterium]MDW8267905.1 metallophosphoesterase family protein [Anaerolineae bacterium]
MRIAVFSDIHANRVALEAVLAVVAELQPDAIWCLGDVVGYGPEPEACVEIIAKRADLCLAGNHDLAVAGLVPLDDFSPDAAAAVRWQQPRLSPVALHWLAQRQPRLVQAGITLAHGSPRDPIWEYVLDAGAAAANLEYFDTQLCLIGHSHLAIAWRLQRQDEGTWVWVRLERRPPGETLDLTTTHRWLLNPGSVGQPRDGDPRASFALLDTEALTWTWHRVPYDVAAVDAAIRAAGLPWRLGRRLYSGQ